MKSKTFAYILTIGGNNIKIKSLERILLQLAASNHKTYIIFRNDSVFVRELIKNFAKKFNFFILEVFDKTLMKNGKLKIIIDKVNEDYVKIIDPDDEINVETIFTYYGNDEFLHVNMLQSLNDNRNKNIIYSTRKTNPSTIFRTDVLKSFSSLNIHYDRIFEEDIYRYLFSAISIKSSNRVTHGYLPGYFGTYILYDDNSTSNYTIRLKKHHYRISVSSKIPIESLKMIINDINNNIILIKWNNIDLIYDILYKLLTNYYIRTKNLDLVMPIIERIAYIRGTNIKVVSDAIYRKSKENDRIERKNNNLIKLKWNSIKNDKLKLLKVT